MAVLPIRTLPDPVLRQKARRVRAVDSSIKKLIADMLETTHADPNRVGLAAPQIGVSLRVIVIAMPEAEDIILVNPEIVRRNGERLVTEGCLSVPGVSGTCIRAHEVVVEGTTLEGKDVQALLASEHQLRLIADRQIGLACRDLLDRRGWIRRDARHDVQPRILEVTRFKALKEPDVIGVDEEVEGEVEVLRARLPILGFLAAARRDSRDRHE